MPPTERRGAGTGRHVNSADQHDDQDAVDGWPFGQSADRGRCGSCFPGAARHDGGGAFGVAAVMAKASTASCR